MKRILGVLMVCAFLCVSCGDDEEPVVVNCTITNFNNTVNQSITALNNSITTYNNDQTVANCDAVKAAAQDYLATVQSFVNCEEISSEYDAQIMAAQDAVDTIVC